MNAPINLETLTEMREITTIIVGNIETILSVNVTWEKRF